MFFFAFPTARRSGPALDSVRADCRVGLDGRHIGHVARDNLVLVLDLVVGRGLHEGLGHVLGLDHRGVLHLDGHDGGDGGDGDGVGHVLGVGDGDRVEVGHVVSLAVVDGLDDVVVAGCGDVLGDVPRLLLGLDDGAHDGDVHGLHVVAVLVNRFVRGNLGRNREKERYMMRSVKEIFSTRNFRNNDNALYTRSGSESMKGVIALPPALGCGAQ